MRGTRVVLQKRVVRDYEGDIKKAGNTVHIPRLSNLPTQTKSAATDITFTAITEGEQVLTVSTHEYAAFQLESIVQVQSKSSLTENSCGYPKRPERVCPPARVD